MIRSSSLVGVLAHRLRGRNTEEIRAHEMAKAKLKRAEAEQAQARSRINFAIIGAGLVYCVIAVKMGVLSVSEPIARENLYVPPVVYGGRADIVDRNGEILATNMPGHSLYVQPHLLVDPKAAAQAVSRIIPEKSYQDLYEMFTIEGAKFRWIKDQISPEQKQAIFELGEPGLQFGAREVRVFPNGPIASHVLGGVRTKEMATTAAEIAGSAGIEYALNSVLSDPENRTTPLKLSIDLPTQTAVEHALYQGVMANNAKGGAAVLMEADTGRVISIASYPDFDPNFRPSAYDSNADASRNPRFNRAAQGVYELGSTFKPFTVSMVLENGIAAPQTYIETGRSVKEGKYTIKDFHYYGDSLTLEDIIVKSSNVGTAKLARGMGAEKQKAFLRELGLLKPTTLELPESASAQPIFPSNWTTVYTMTISYGHGISVTPVHLAAAYSTLVNGGFKVEPTLLQDKPAPKTPERLISAKTSMQIREMLRAVVQRGTATHAQTDGYDIGGKTGTADKPRASGGYYEDRNINTFAAAFPMSDPKYVVVVVLDEPNAGAKDRRTAGWTVVPVTKNIVDRVAPLLDVRPNYTADLPMVARVVSGAGE